MALLSRLTFGPTTHSVEAHGQPTSVQLGRKWVGRHTLPIEVAGAEVWFEQCLIGSV
jgi:hypothetical protein